MEFYHLKCYAIRDAYHILSATHGLYKVQGFGEAIFREYERGNMGREL